MEIYFGNILFVFVWSKIFFSN